MTHPEQPSQSMVETTLSSETLYQGKIVRFHVDQIQLPDGRESTRAVVDHPGAVCVLPMTPEREVILVKQYRYAIGEVLLEAPAGTCHPGEPPAETAYRELIEETGYEAQSWDFLGEAWSAPGFCSERMHFYIARDLVARGQQPDPDENIEVVRLPFDTCLQKVAAGEIHDAKTMVILLRAEQFFAHAVK